MKRKNYLLLVVSLAFMIGLASCKKNVDDTLDPEINLFEGLNLPETPYNYAFPDLPAFLSLQPVNGADNTPANNPVTNDGATLGRVLFHDVNLSLNRTVSCASCHIQANSFSDPLVLSKGFNNGNTGRHSMSLINARYYNNGRFFWDERAVNLEDQVLRPIQDQVEMGLTLDTLLSRIQSRAFYPVLFKKAFGSEDISTDKIAKALAQYVRSIISYQSKFDAGRALVQDINDPFPNFSTVENQGKQIFFGPIGNCAPCHGTEAFIAPGARNNGLDADNSIDKGVGGVTGVAAGEGLFKTPSLKNIALTAPYMHDGRFATLEQVIEHYSSGVKDNPNLSGPLRTPNNTVRLANFTQAQKNALLAFLNTLTDNTILSDPKFSNPFTP